VVMRRMMDLRGFGRAAPETFRQSGLLRAGAPVTLRTRLAAGVPLSGEVPVCFDLVHASANRPKGFSPFTEGGGRRPRPWPAPLGLALRRQRDATAVGGSCGLAVVVERRAAALTQAHDVLLAVLTRGQVDRGRLDRGVPEDDRGVVPRGGSRVADRVLFTTPRGDGERPRMHERMDPSRLLGHVSEPTSGCLDCASRAMRTTWRRIERVAQRRPDHPAPSRDRFAAAGAAARDFGASPRPRPRRRRRAPLRARPRST
jgi:hypothetical protein